MTGSRAWLTALTLGLAWSAHAGTRIPLGDTAASASTTYPNRDPKYAVNGAGLSGDQHSNAGDYATWMTQSSGAISGAWFRVDLGQVYPLDSFKLWNFNFWHATVATTNRGIQRAEVYLSSASSNPGSDFSNTAVWTRVLPSVTFAKAPGQSTYTGEPHVSLAGHSGRWLALRVLANFGGSGADTVGLSELQVFANSTPIVNALSASVTSETQAVLAGALAYTGGADTHVYAHWGTTDGGTVSSAWSQVSALGVTPLGDISAPVSVAPETAYTFRFRAINSDGTSWSQPLTFITAPVTVEMPATVLEGAGTLTVTLRRPQALTNSALTVRYTTGGTALPGTHYAPLSGVATFPAGAETVPLAVTLLDNVSREEDERTLTVSLTSDACLVTEQSAATTTILDDDTLLDTTRWNRHMTVTLGGYTGASALTQFPVALRLSEQLPGFRYADFSSPADGADLRVTDTATGQTLAHEIELWNPSGTSVVWVSVATLSGTATELTLHWKNPAASMPGYTTSGSAWDYGFSGVWHLDATAAADSTREGNHGTAYGNVTAMPGLLGQALAFNGSNYVQVPHHTSLGADVATNLTLSTWFRPSVTLQRTNDTIRLIEKGDGYFFIQGYSSQGGLVFLFKQNDTNLTSIGNGADIPSNEWHHACATYNGATMRLFLDGTQVASTSRTGPIDDDQLPLRIGSDDSGKYFKGLLDETRIERTARSADWVKACYDSQTDGSTFATYGAVYRTLRGSLIAIF